MRRSLHLATLLGVALAFTACTDSVQLPITAPDGLRSGHAPGTPLSSAQYALLAEIDGLGKALYACAPSKISSNRDKDQAKLEEYGEFGHWTSSDNPSKPTSNVRYVADKMIEAAQGDFSKGVLCNDADDLAQYILLLNAYAGSGTGSETGDVQAELCTNADGCETQNPKGWGLTIPPGTFDEDVIVIVRPYNGPFPNPNAQVGKGWHFDVYPEGLTANNAWTRWICWAGNNPGVDDDDPAVNSVVMVRDGGEGNLDYLETAVADWNFDSCEPVNTTMNPILKGAYKIFAGLPFLPRDAHAYLPTRTFGGTSTASSPHWLEVVDPIPGYSLQDLYDLTQQYYGESNPNQTAALGKVSQAIACGDDAECVNSALDGYIKNVTAQAGKQGLSFDDALTLIGIALGLMQ